MAVERVLAVLIVKLLNAIRKTKTGRVTEPG